MVAETMKTVSVIFKEMNVKDADGNELGDSPSPDQIANALSAIDEDDEDSNKFENMTDSLVEIIADFCQGHPTMDSLDALAWPKFMAFFGYIMENMLSPEASVPGTNSTPRALKSV